MSRAVVVLSDTHLGTDKADPAGLEAFLSSLAPRAPRLRLVLNGDIVDLWRTTEARAARASRGVFAALAELLGRGAYVDWVIGNHDHHLLRSLDARAAGDESRGASPVLDAIPVGVRFHHPYRRLVVDGRVFVITHGDVYDFLYMPLEDAGPLGWVLSPRDIYSFYDWVYGLDKKVVAGFDRVATRALVSRWLLDRWSRVWGALDASKKAPPADRSLVAHSAADALGREPNRVALDLTRLPLEEVWGRNRQVLRWRGARYLSPHPSSQSRRRFGGYDHLIVGHFHAPRNESGRGWAVTDDGSWWHGPTKGGTYVEIERGAVTLRKYRS